MCSITAQTIPKWKPNGDRTDGKKIDFHLRRSMRNLRLHNNYISEFEMGVHRNGFQVSIDHVLAKE